jgi:hypothetical protein
MLKTENEALMLLSAGRMRSMFVFCPMNKERQTISGKTKSPDPKNQSKIQLNQVPVSLISVKNQYPLNPMESLKICTY